MRKSDNTRYLFTVAYSALLISLEMCGGYNVYLVEGQISNHDRVKCHVGCRQDVLADWEPCECWNEKTVINHCVLRDKSLRTKTGTIFTAKYYSQMFHLLNFLFRLTVFSKSISFETAAKVTVLSTYKKGTRMKHLEIRCWGTDGIPCDHCPV